MFDKDLFLSICKEYDVELSQAADSPMLKTGEAMSKLIEFAKDQYEIFPKDSELGIFLRAVVKTLEIKKIPVEKIKQAREEMKACSYSLRCFNEDVFDEDEIVVDLNDVLPILDKLIKEVEE